MSLTSTLLLVLLASSPAPPAEIRVEALAPEEVERTPELRIDGVLQNWHEAKDGTWRHRTKLSGLHRIALKAPMSPEDDGAVHEFWAPLGPGVKIDLEGWFTAAIGPAGPRCLYVDAPDEEADQWQLCHGDPGVPTRKVMDLAVPNLCPRPAMRAPTFLVVRKGAGFIEFFDTLPGLYIARVQHGRVALMFTPGAKARARPNARE